MPKPMQPGYWTKLFDVRVDFDRNGCSTSLDSELDEFVSPSIKSDTALIIDTMDNWDPFGDDGVASKGTVTGTFPSKVPVDPRTRTPTTKEIPRMNMAETISADKLGNSPVTRPLSTVAIQDAQKSERLAVSVARTATRLVRKDRKR